MLQSLKSWIEGLFRPVIVETPSGSYIDRTPTIHDLIAHESPLTNIERWTTALQADHDTTAVTIPPGPSWIIRRALICPTTALTAGSFVFMVSIDNRAYVALGPRSHNITGAGTKSPSSLDFYGSGTLPVLLRPGDKFYFNSYNNPAGTHDYIVWYNEVDAI